MSNEVEQIIERVKVVAINYLSNVAKAISATKVEAGLLEYEAYHHEDPRNVEKIGITFIEEIIGALGDISSKSVVGYKDVEDFVSHLRGRDAFKDAFKLQSKEKGKEITQFKKLPNLGKFIAYNWVDSDLHVSKLKKIDKLYDLVGALRGCASKKDALVVIKNYTDAAKRGTVRNELVALHEDLQLKDAKSSAGFWSCFSSAALEVKDRAPQATEKKDIVPGVSA